MSNFETSAAQALDAAFLRDQTTDSADRGTSAQALLPLDKSPGFSLVQIPLAGLSQGALSFGLKGYGVVYLMGLSTPGPTLMIHGQTPLQPGGRFDGYFENLSVALPFGTTTNYVSGNVALLVLTRPDVDYRETYNTAFGQTYGLLIPPVPVTPLFTTANNYIGADGSTGSTPQSVPAFNFSGYKAVQAFLSFNTLTGGTSPLLALHLIGYPSPTDVNSIVDENGPALGTGPTGLVSGLGYPNQTATPDNFFSLLPPYARFQVQSSGGPTGLTGSGLLYIFGLR